MIPIFENITNHYTFKHTFLFKDKKKNNNSL